MRRENRVLNAALIGLLAVGTAFAQNPPDERKPPGPGAPPAGPHGQGRMPNPGTRPGPGFAHRRGEGPGGPLGPVGQYLLQLTPEDRSPLRDGEAAELLAFAQAHLPRMANLLTELQQHDPQKFEERMAHMAPRLRHLKRVFEANPKLGEIVRDRAENAFDIERDLQALRAAALGTPDYESVVQKLRDRVALEVKYDADALETLAATIDQDRAPFVERRVQHLIGENADLAPVPPRMRELVSDYRSATTDAARAAALAQIRATVEERVGTELEALRNRARRMREQAAEQVDRRMERLLSSHAPRDGRDCSPAASGPAEPGPSEPNPTVSGTAGSGSVPAR